MVRLKTRYIIFQLRYPDQKDCGNTSVSEDREPFDILIESSATLSPKLLISTLRLSLSRNFGDDALSDSLTTFSIKYFSNKTSTGILRVHRDSVDKVLAAMFFVQTLEGRNVIWDSVGVCGSIKKCERLAINRNKELIKRVKKIDNRNIDYLLESFETDNNNDDEKEEL